MPIDGRKLLVPLAFSVVVLIASFVFEMLESPAEQTAFTENVDAYNAKKEEIMQLLYDSHDTNVAGGVSACPRVCLGARVHGRGTPAFSILYVAV